MDSPLKEKPVLPFRNLYLNSGVIHGLNHWWMYIFGVFAIISGYSFFQAIISFPLFTKATAAGYSIEELQSNPGILFNPDLIHIDKNIMLVFMFGMFVFALLFLFFVLKYLHKKTLTSVITAYQKIRFGRYFFGMAVWGGLVLLFIFASYLMSPGEFILQFNPARFSVLFLISIIFIPIQTATEEIIFRGYLVQGLSLAFKNGIVPVIITSLLFGLIHMQNPEADAYGWGVMLPYYSLFGLFLGLITLLDEGLELAMGIHCANNLFSGLMITSPNGVLKTDAVFAVKSDDPSGELIAWSIMAVITFTIFWLKYRWKNFNLILK